MKAIVQDRYGAPDVLELRDIDQPEVGDDGVLVRVRAAAVNAADWHIMRGEPYLARIGLGLRRPKYRVGVDAAGEVVAVGKNVEQLRPGDEVFGASFGAFAEYVSADASRFAPRPAGLSYEEAAAAPVTALTALHGLRDEGELQPGQSVLINGASGGVGTFAVQIAKAFGATVTGVCSTAKVEMVDSIGADEVIDYTREDFVQPGRYDLVLDMAANRPLSDFRRALSPGGAYVIVGGPNGRWLGPIAPFIRMRLSARFVPQKLRGVSFEPQRDNLIALKELIESGDVKPVVDRTYPLSEVPEAIRYLEAGHAQGKIVITV